MRNKVIIGDATLYLGDCVEILPLVGKVDAVITDPPYGINENSKKVASRERAAKVRDYGEFDWDKKPPAPELVESLRSMSDWQAFFGGNYFILPPTSCWLVWDKLNSGDFADCELAWTNWPKAVRRIQWRWNGMIRQGNEERYHPTQKPLEVMKWAIDLCPKADMVLDPFMGSGTTGVAAIQLGRKFIGIERDPRYFEIACRRIEQAVAQGQLFAPEPAPKQEQTGLFEDAA
jgi:site-specific DNA-methyltransferase (adenine-specific)/modification methylase